MRLPSWFTMLVTGPALLFSTCHVINTDQIENVFLHCVWLYVELQFFQISAINSPIQSNCTYNLISPCGPFCGASHCGTQIVIKARRSAQRAGWLLTAGFRAPAVPSHCCWQEIYARRWCVELELIWSGLLLLKGTGPKVMHYGKSGDNFHFHDFLL